MRFSKRFLSTLCRRPDGSLHELDQPQREVEVSQVNQSLSSLRNSWGFRWLPWYLARIFVANRLRFDSQLDVCRSSLVPRSSLAMPQDLLRSLRRSKALQAQHATSRYARLEKKRISALSATKTQDFPMSSERAREVAHFKRKTRAGNVNSWNLSSPQTAANCR